MILNSLRSQRIYFLQKVMGCNRLCLVFDLGKYAPIDASDAGGMNLLDLKTMDWSPVCLDVSKSNLIFVFSN